MHQSGIVLAGEDVTGAAHIRGELINLIKAAVDDSAGESGIPQIADDKIIGFALREFMKLQVDTPHPVSIALQPFYQVAADEAACATDQCTLRHNASPCASTSYSPQLLEPGGVGAPPEHFNSALLSCLPPAPPPHTSPIHPATP